jgi:hypothetical protein
MLHLRALYTRCINTSASAHSHILFNLNNEATGATNDTRPTCSCLSMTKPCVVPNWRRAADAVGRALMRHSKQQNFRWLLASNCRCCASCLNVNVKGKTLRTRVRNQLQHSPRQIRHAMQPSLHTMSVMVEAARYGNWVEVDCANQNRDSTVNNVTCMTCTS